MKYPVFFAIIFSSILLIGCNGDVMGESVTSTDTKKLGMTSSVDTEDVTSHIVPISPKITVDEAVIADLEAYTFPIYSIQRFRDLSGYVPDQYRAAILDESLDSLNRYLEILTGIPSTVGLDDVNVGSIEPNISYYGDETIVNVFRTQVSVAICGDIKEVDRVLSHPYVTALMSYCEISDPKILDFRDFNEIYALDYDPDYILIQNTSIQDINTRMSYPGFGIASRIHINSFDNETVSVSGYVGGTDITGIYSENADYFHPEEAVIAWFGQWRDYDEMTFRVIDIIYQVDDSPRGSYLLPHYRVIVQFDDGNVLGVEKIPMYREVFADPEVAS